ncbi:SDR family oxidoreductase [Candidatus Saccharibacteria bacterium]|nr:SDR family oxidoreductase [Candidatus Saccharibacteria bacterium]
MNLQNKVIVITGSSSGIGAAMAKRFANEGARLVVNYCVNETGGGEVLKEIQKISPESILIQADIRKDSDVEHMRDEIKAKFGRVDILINNTGYYQEGDSPDNFDAIEKTFAVNFFGQVRVTNAVRELMSKGKIIFTSSVNGRIGYGGPDTAGYSATKAALDSYMKNLAKEVAPNILVNSIRPGRTLTPIWGGITKEYEVELMQGVATGNWVTPEEIADGAAFLAKNDSMCGEILTIDGGMGLRIFG